MKRLLNKAAFLLVAAVWFAACALPPASTVIPIPDELADILALGRVVVATDPNYPPQSELVAGAARPAGTKCQPAEYTASELRGFDIDVTAEVARRLGVEPCFVAPTWTQMIAGSWADRWDICADSMTITSARMQVLYFTQPYYTSPAAFFVHKDNVTYTQPSDLSGKRIGVCTGCTYEIYLKGQLSLPGQKVASLVKNPVIVGYAVDSPALRDLAQGDGVRLDAVLTDLAAGLTSQRQGLPIKMLGNPVYTEYIALAVDKKSSRDPTTLVERLTAIIQAMHADGTLLRLSQAYYGQDLTTAASRFDLHQLSQSP